MHRNELLARIRASLRRKETIDHKVNATQQRLQSATERKSHLLTNMSHELRTKLDTIIGFSEVLQEQFCGKLNAQQAEYVNYILTSGTDLLMGVNGLLEMTKMEIGEATLQLRMLPLRPLLEECLELVRGHAQAHAVTLSLTVDDDIDRVTGDEIQLKQIIFYLLSMVIKSASDNGQAGIEVDQTDQTIRIAVWSAGTAMVPEAQLPLESFDESQETVSLHAVGPATGLALTKRFIELHRGTLDVQHQTGQGNTLILSLPVPDQPFDSPSSAV